jgi:hypothetical protein
VHCCCITAVHCKVSTNLPSAVTATGTAAVLRRTSLAQSVKGFVTAGVTDCLEGMSLVPLYPPAGSIGITGAAWIACMVVAGKTELLLCDLL